MEEDIRTSSATAIKTSTKVEERLEAAIEEASKRIKYDSAHDEEILRSLSLVAEFIKDKKRVCYGGTAMNSILPQSKKFYNPELDLPDYDFYTPDVEGDVEELVALLNKEGFKDVYHKVGIHEGTKKILVNFVPVADVSSIEPELFAVLLRRSILKDGMYYTDDIILRMMMYLELSRPKGMVERWPKVYERLQLINELFPIRGCVGVATGEPPSTIPLGIRKSILEYIIEWKRILCNGAMGHLYARGIRKRDAVYRIQEGGAVLFTSPDPKIDAFTLKKKLGEGIELFRHKQRGEIVPERFELRLKGKTICVIVEETACHSYVAFPTSDERQIYIASLEFLITLYLSLSIFTTHAKDILGDSVLCQVKQFIRLSNENHAAKKSQFPPFSLQCRGHQTGFASLLREKVKRVRRERGELGSVAKSIKRRHSAARHSGTHKLRSKNKDKK
jgi:hypothetical protein